MKTNDVLFRHFNSAIDNLRPSLPPQTRKQLLAEMVAPYESPMRSFHNLDLLVYGLGQLERNSDEISRLNDYSPIKRACMTIAWLMHWHNPEVESSKEKTDILLTLCEFPTPITKIVLAMITATSEHTRHKDRLFEIMHDLPITNFGESITEFPDFEQRRQTEVLQGNRDRKDYAKQRIRELTEYTSCATIFQSFIFRSQFESQALSNIEHRLGELSTWL